MKEKVPLSVKVFITKKLIFDKKNDILDITKD